MVTNAELQGMYHTFNKKWFGNRLPKDMVVCFLKLSGCSGMTSFYRNRSLYIHLNVNLRIDRSATAMTLLHEMVHVALPYGVAHSSKFHRRMLRLAKQGAFKKWW